MKKEEEIKKFHKSWMLKHKGMIKELDSKSLEKYQDKWEADLKEFEEKYDNKEKLEKIKIAAQLSIERKAERDKKLKEINWPAWANENYNTVVLKRPDDQIVNKWQLAVQGDLVHILVMPHADKKRINGLIHELQASKK